MELSSVTFHATGRGVVAAATDRYVLAAGNSGPMLYHLFPQPPYQRPFVRTLTSQQRSEAETHGVSLFALPEALRRMQASERVSRIDGVALLAGAEGAE